MKKIFTTTIIAIAALLVFGIVYSTLVNKTDSILDNKTSQTQYHDFYENYIPAELEAIEHMYE